MYGLYNLNQILMSSHLLSLLLVIVRNCTVCFRLAFLVYLGFVFPICDLSKKANPIWGCGWGLRSGLGKGCWQRVEHLSDNRLTQIFPGKATRSKPDTNTLCLMSGQQTKVRTSPNTISPIQTSTLNPQPHLGFVSGWLSRKNCTCLISCQTFEPHHFELWARHGGVSCRCSVKQTKT